MKALIRWRFTWLSVLVVVVLGAVLAVAALLEEDAVEYEFDRDLYGHYVSLAVTNEADIVLDYEWQQVMYMPLLLPDPEEILIQPGGILPVLDWTGFSDRTLKGLVPVERDGITYYPVTVVEDAKHHFRLVLNANDEVIARLAVPDDYDPAWWVKEHYPELYETRLTAEQDDDRARLEAMFDGSRLAITYDLIDHDNLIALVWKQSIQAAQAAAAPPGGMMMSMSSTSYSNIQFTAIERYDTNGVMSVTLGYPDGFTNQISLIVCTNLLVQDWSLLVTTNPPSGTNTFTYIDTAAANYDIRFYHAYNADADTDGDGVPDVNERIDGTDPDDPNDPPNIKGTITYESYSGGQTGLIWVVAVTSSNSWSTNYNATIAAPGDYHIVDVPSGSYWIKAWRDSDGDEQADTYEAQAFYTNSAVSVTGQFTGADIALVDPDTDSDDLADWWEYEYFFGLSQTATGDGDEDDLSNLAEFRAGTDPNVADTGYIPNDKYGQDWPTNIPIAAPNFGAPTQEREYKFSFSGLTSIRPNDGVARALMERIDDTLADLLSDRSNWTVYAALDVFQPGGDVHNITNPTDNAEFTLEFSPNNPGADTDWPTHTAFVDVYFDTTNALSYIYEASYRLRQRFDNTERWYAHAGGDTNAQQERVEFMSKVYRMTDEQKPGFSEVTESRGPVVSLPPLPATNIQDRIDDFQDGRWPADMQAMGGGTHPEATKVGNPAWYIREYLVDVAPEVTEYTILKYRPELVLVSERRRQHLFMDGLLLGWVPGVFSNVYIISVDAAHLYEQGPMLAYMKGETNAMPPSLGSFVELEIEFERDTSDGLDDLIAAETNAVVYTNLVLLRDAFLADQSMMIQAIQAEFNSKPNDLTAFYTIKTGLNDMTAHGQTNGTGITRESVQGICGSGLAFDGSGYVALVPDTNPTPNTVTVEASPAFILSEFQSRANRDAITDDDGEFPDWIEIQNVTSSSQSLNGWYLTDDDTDLTRWQFPNVSLGAGEYLVVFADGVDRTDPAFPLHTDFAIGGGGEYLALVRPNGTTIATEYDTPSIMDFDYDVSYGIVTNGSGEYIEGYFNASPGESNEGLYRPTPLELGNADFTISLWLKTSNAGVALLARSDTNGTLGTGEKQLYVDANGVVRYIGQGAGSIVGTTDIDDGQWHHIAVIFAAGTGTSKLYVDGDDDTNTGATDYTATADASGTGLYLGYDTSTQATSDMNGTLDEIAIWARTLSATEIAAIHDDGDQGVGLDTRGLLNSGLVYHGSMDVFLIPNADTKYSQAFQLLYDIQ